MISSGDFKRFMVVMMPLILVFSIICILSLVSMNTWIRFIIYAVMGMVIIWYEYNVRDFDDL